MPQPDAQNAWWSLSPAPLPPSAGLTQNFSIPTDAARADIPLNTAVDPHRVYQLPELIDLAQRTNLSTRTAWERARQAALAVGMVEATFLPMLTAGVIGGYQENKLPLFDFKDRNISLDTTSRGVTQSLALEWLVFDFGKRQALAAAAKQNAFAANVLFNGSHQKLIFDVSRAYYTYGAAEQRVKFLKIALKNTQEVRAAVYARRSQGLATVVETAQANQAVAQAKLRLVQAQGAERDADQALLTVVGVHQPLKIDTVDATHRPLPKPSSVALDAAMQQALAARPDVAASYAAWQASKSSVNAAEAGYLPKVFATGILARGTRNFETGGLPSFSQFASGNGFLLGITVPLYDAGLRDARLREAQSRAALAETEFHRVQNAAITEIVAARNALTTALESYQAATALVQAAEVTHNAALAAYRHGMGTLDVALVADNALVNAQQAQADAHAAALIGALKLAFVLGALTSNPPN